jgi:hypothetical protein
MIRTYCVILVLVTFLSACATSQAGEKALALRKSFPIQVFMRACVSGRADPIAVADQARAMGFSQAEDSAARRYLHGKGGAAWQLQTDAGKFGLAVADNTLCSVFVHQGSAEKIQTSMEAWLPSKDSGFSYKKELVTSSGPLSTAAYKIFRSGQLIEQWVITTNTQPNAELVAVMSYDRP